MFDFWSFFLGQVSIAGLILLVFLKNRIKDIISDWLFDRKLKESDTKEGEKPL